MADLVARLESATAPRATVGIGIPGTISPATGAVKNANSTWLIGRPFGADLEQALHRPVRLANDANCFALSEAVDGAGAGAEVVFGVIVGTGTGGGIVVRGHVLTGPNAVAGEWGHNPLPWPEADEWPGTPCYCGRSGCIETFLSGPGLAADYGRATGLTLKAEDVVARAAAGEGAAQETLARYDVRMARALASIINVLDPRRDRARGRVVEPRAPVRGRPQAVVGVGVLGPGGHAPRAPSPRRQQRGAGSGVALGVNPVPSAACACRGGPRPGGLGRARGLW